MNWTCHTPEVCGPKMFWELRSAICSPGVHRCSCRHLCHLLKMARTLHCLLCKEKRWPHHHFVWYWERTRDWANGRLANCFETSDAEILGAGQFISISFNTLMGLALRLCTGVCGCPRLWLYSGNQRCTARLSWYGDMDLHGLYGLCLCSPQCKDNLSDSLKLSQVLAMVSNSQRKQ